MNYYCDQEYPSSSDLPFFLFVHFLSNQMESEENNENPDVNNEGERGKYRALEARLEVKRCMVVLIKLTREKKQIETFVGLLGKYCRNDKDRARAGGWARGELVLFVEGEKALEAARQLLVIGRV